MRFWFKLALALSRPIKQLMREIDSEEFSWWLAYYKVDPFGPERDDLRSAIQSQLLANINRDTKKKPTPFTIKDFMPDFNPKEPSRPTEEHRKAIKKKFMKFIKQWQ